MTSFTSCCAVNEHDVITAVAADELGHLFARVVQTAFDLDSLPLVGVALHLSLKPANGKRKTCIYGTSPLHCVLFECSVHKPVDLVEHVARHSSERSVVEERDVFVEHEL